MFCPAVTCSGRICATAWMALFCASSTNDAGLATSPHADTYGSRLLVPQRACDAFRLDRAEPRAAPGGPRVSQRSRSTGDGSNQLPSPAPAVRPASCCSGHTMARSPLAPLLILASMLGMVSTSSALSSPTVKAAVQSDISPKPLRAYAVSSAVRGPQAAATGPTQRVVPLGRPNITYKGSPTKSGVAATVASANVQRNLALENGLDFEGVGNDEYGYTVQYIPPDTEGNVGTTQYVQWVNVNLAVFNKTDGSNELGTTIPGNSIFDGFGGGCETNNDGDPIMQFDKHEQRWIITQFSVSTTPYLQCVAVSLTDDAAGYYYRYAFDHGDSSFNDYSKTGVWPTALFQTFNIFDGGDYLEAFAGPLVCALDKFSMYAGAAATEQCFQLDSQYGSLLPADLDGQTPPPAGSPNYLVSYGTSNNLLLWQFNADFADPSQTFLTGPTSIPVTPFTPACGASSDQNTVTNTVCAPQPGTKDQIDTLSDRLMYRFAYRNFGTHESLLVNHAIEVGSTIGVRWYELRNPGAAKPSVYQSGTYSPDGDARFMGSIAMDRVGNIALGYSVSGPSTYPGIRYTARAPTDPLGQLSAFEVSAQEGMGSQIGQSRWGDYSAMVVDPVDDCTFWYTNQYLRENGAYNWNTKIVSFSFASCRKAIPSPPPPHPPPRPPPPKKSPPSPPPKRPPPPPALRHSPPPAKVSHSPPPPPPHSPPMKRPPPPPAARKPPPIVPDPIPHNPPPAPPRRSPPPPPPHRKPPPPTAATQIPHKLGRRSL